VPPKEGLRPDQERAPRLSPKQPAGAGVYHFDPRGPALTCFREGDRRAHLVRAAASEPAVARAPLVLVLTGLPWRTAWKYTSLLHVALQDGFQADAVIIRVNGEEVFNRQDVSTKTQVGSAGAVELMTEEGSASVEVVLPLKQLSMTIPVQLSTPVM